MIWKMIKVFNKKIFVLITDLLVNEKYLWTCRMNTFSEYLNNIIFILDQKYFIY